MKFNGVDEYVSIADNATLDVDASSDVLYELVQTGADVDDVV